MTPSDSPTGAPTDWPDKIVPGDPVSFPYREMRHARQEGYIDGWNKAIDACERAALSAQAPPAPDHSREMFVARLENMQKNGDRWLTTEAVLALLDDCDMLASRGTPQAAIGAPPDLTNKERIELEHRRGWMSRNPFCPITETRCRACPAANARSSG